MIFELFLFLFAFVLGGLTVVTVGVAAFYYYLRILNLQKEEHKIISSAADLPPVEQSDQTQHQLAGFLRVHTNQLVKRSSLLLGQSAKQQPWSYGVLKGNMLFKFKDSQATGVAQVTCLDGCSVEVTSSNWAAKSTAIKIEHPERDLMGRGTRCVYLYFINGKELEEWYYALKRAATLSQNLEAVQAEDERVHHYFSLHCHSLSQSGSDNAWCNAILARFWWNFSDNKSFHRFICRGLCERIKKMTDFPGFIESMVLEDMRIGSNLPMVSNATLASITERGEVDVDMDVVYHTGFEMRISVNTSLNLPGASVKVPASAYMQIKQLSGRMRLHVSPPPCERFWIGFHKEPQFDINAETTIGAQSLMPSMVQMANNLMKKLDITNIIVNKFKANIINETLVLPNMDEWPMPFWPEQEEEEEDMEKGLVIYTRPVSAESEKKSSLWKMIDISPEGITVMGTSVVRGGSTSDKGKEKGKDA
jgi:hypothetical protein